MPITPAQLLDWKRQHRPIVALTAWDTAIAAILDEAGVEMILVGDSLGMVALGYETTLPVTLDAMIHHAAAVKRGVKRALVICDLPFLSYQESPSQAIQAAGRVLKETGAQAVKLEGGHPRLVETVSRLTEIGIPVMGHVGLTPQSVHQLGYRQQGQDPVTADKIHKQAIALEKAGSFAVVLEHIPAALATEISQGLTIPTIGIGAGSGCDGQVLVTADLLGLTPKQPPFAPAYLNLRQIITDTVQQYSDNVRQGRI
ncbi:MAG: 3-methyl-2-oxobutanoate hydroxymethyltransferase [Synechocystis sp.]|nr:3-methyl-2-oxobutanoate hydroxymethyltransferase [Synechocystis sp.]